MFNWLVNRFPLLTVVSFNTILITIGLSKQMSFTFFSWQLKRAHQCQKKSQMASADCNDIEMRHENSCSRCECNACADPKRFRPQLASCSGAYSCAPVSPDWDYMVSGVPNRTKEGETRIVTEVLWLCFYSHRRGNKNTEMLKLFSSNSFVIEEIAAMCYTGIWN